MPIRPQQQPAPKKGMTLEQVVNSLEGIGRALNALIAAPLGRVTLKEGVLLGIGTTWVTHNLGRPVRRYIVVSKNAAANIHDGSSPDPSTTLALTSDAICTVDLLLL